MNCCHKNNHEISQFQLGIQGKLGGARPAERVLLELASACLDLGIEVFIDTTERITGAVPEDPRPLLLAQCPGIPQDRPVHGRIVSGAIPPEPDNGSRLVWIPDPHHARARHSLPEIAPSTEIWCDPPFAARNRLSHSSPLPVGINPLRFHPGVAPFPLPIPAGAFIFFYHGALCDEACRNLVEACRPYLAQNQFYLVINDYGAEPDCEAAVPVYQGVVRVSGIGNERQMAGLYAAANCLIDPRPFDTLEKLEALGCGVPVLTPTPVAMADQVWNPPDLLHLENWSETIDQVIRDYRTWQRAAAQGCRQVQAVMNWHETAARVLLTYNRGDSSCLIQP